MSTACTTTVAAGSDPAIFMLGTRVAAADLRDQVEVGLAAGSVCVDFQGVLVSQSFMDEFLGVLITRYGPQVLDRVEFKNCHEEVRAAAHFVTHFRAREYDQARVRS